MATQQLNPDGTPILTAPTAAPTDGTVTPPPSGSANPDGTPLSIYQKVAGTLAANNTVDPTMNTFDESKGVAGRVASITGQDSPLMQRARVQGTQLAAQRGLTNSSLAGEAEQNSVLAAATPIATSDASLYQQSALANQTASNAAKTTNAQLGVTAGVAGMQSGTQAASTAESARQFNVTADTNKSQFAQNLDLQIQQLDTQKQQFAAQLGLSVQDLDLRRDQLTQQQQQALDQLNLQKSQLAQQQTQFQSTQAQQLVMQKLTGDQQIAVTTLQGQNQQAINSNTNIANAWGTMMQNIQAIQNNANLDGPAKQTLVQNTLDAFSSYANFWKKVSGGSIDVGDLLNFGVTGAAPNASAGSTPGAGVSGSPSQSTILPIGGGTGGAPTPDQSNGA